MIILINITNIKHGWLTLIIDGNKFTASYLSDVKEELDKLFNLPDNDLNVNRIYLDGEGKDLYLTAWRVFDRVTIVWELDGDKPMIKTINADYSKIIKEYNLLWRNIGEDYKNNFSLENYI